MFLPVDHIGKPTDAFRVGSLTTSPSNALPGDDLTVDLVGTATSVIDVRFPTRLSDSGNRGRLKFKKSIDFTERHNGDGLREVRQPPIINQELRLLRRSVSTKIHDICLGCVLL